MLAGAAMARHCAEADEGIGEIVAAAPAGVETAGALPEPVDVGYRGRALRQRFDLFC